MNSNSLSHYSEAQDDSPPAETPDNVWHWHLDGNYRISSVSSSFSMFFGATATATITGKTWWKFCDNLDEPNKNWRPLADALEQRRRIKKFIFSLTTGGRIFKIQITGEPVYQNGRFEGYKGFGALAENDQKTWADLNANAIYETLDALNIGTAIFSDEKILEDYNENFTDHMRQAGVRVEAGMTLATLFAHLRARNSIVIDTETPAKSERGKSLKSVELQLKSGEVLSLNLGLSETQRHVLRSEYNVTTATLTRNFEEKSRALITEKKLLSERLEKYKQKSDTKTPRPDLSAVRQEIRKNDENILGFLQNYLDIGVVCSGKYGEIKHINYAAATATGFISIRDCLKTAGDIYSLPNYDPYRKDLEEQILTDMIDRKEREIFIGTENEGAFFKEVIAPYPSVFKPEGFFTFWYETGKPSCEESDASNELTEILDTLYGFIRHAEKPLEHINELDKEKFSPEEYAERLEETGQQIQKTLSVFKTLYNTREKGKHLTEEIISADDLFESVIQETVKEAENKNINVQIEFPAKELNILCDIQAMKQAFSALMSNAVHVSPEFGRIRLHLQYNENNGISVTVSDSGDGDPEESLKTDREINFELTESLLKLKIAKLNFLAHGCNFTVKSYKGLGASVKADIPAFRVIEKSKRQNPDTFTV